MKSKDVLDAFKELGMEKKSGANADDVEFALFFQKVTKAHQIENLDEYVTGAATIRIERTPEEQAELDAKAAEKAAKAAAPKVEPAKAEVKAAPKAEPAKAEVKAAPKAEPAKAEVKEAPKAEPAKIEVKEAPKAAPKPNPLAIPNQMPRRLDKPLEQIPPKPARPAQPQGQKGGFDRQQRNGDGRDNRDNRQGGRRFDNGYSARPQENPFAKKLDNMRREAQGFIITFVAGFQHLQVIFFHPVCFFFRDLCGFRRPHTEFMEQRGAFSAVDIHGVKGEFIQTGCLEFAQIDRMVAGFDVFELHGFDVFAFFIIQRDFGMKTVAVVQKTVFGLVPVCHIKLDHHIFRSRNERTDIIIGKPRHFHIVEFCRFLFDLFSCNR